MSSVDYLREFVSERLTAAAEEIFRVFKKTVVEYEEELERQRRLLGVVSRPEVKLHRIEFQEQHVCAEQEDDQQLCDQERNSSLDPDPPRVKEEQEELCPGPEGQQLALKQEDIETFIWNPTYDDEESDDSEDQTPDGGVRAAQAESVVNAPVINSVASEANSELRLLSDDSGDAESTSDPLNAYVTAHDARGGKQPFKCDTCGKEYRFKSILQRHQRRHTGEKPYSCSSCGKRFSYSSALKCHSRIHTGDKPYLCKACGRRFSDRTTLVKHARIHADEKPHVCATCGRRFGDPSTLKQHAIVHTGERPYACESCGKRFGDMPALRKHSIMHTGEKPHVCRTCGKDFRRSGELTVHMRRAHTGEKPYLCKTCGRGFPVRSALSVHARIHTGEKPYVCETCGKHFRQSGQLSLHMKRAHAGEQQQVFSGPDPEPPRSQREASVLTRHSEDQTLRLSPDQSESVVGALNSAADGELQPPKPPDSTRTGKKFFRCDTCGKDFEFKSVFQRHVRMHTGEKPYSCSQCGKRYSRRSALNIHFRIHAGEDPLL